MAAEFQTLFGGEWKEYKNENVEKVLEAMGMNVITRKAAMQCTPVMTFATEGDTIKVTLKMGPKTENTSFELGKQFDSKAMVEGKATALFSDGKLTVEMTPSDGDKKSVTIVREIVNGEMVQTMVCEGVQGKRIFKKC
ncbi:fatty acid-binding protein, intestinal-like [Mya arenaria]|uniref:fatty acid-binding protein, intestinal-like n=1 Tax=Mya arenaria TaxID=6604 RepID=UPI0022E1BC83|nr:fatty acid-binding protein, intestinal-like [Mya arenaria]